MIDTKMHPLPDEGDMEIQPSDVHGAEEKHPMVNVHALEVHFKEITAPIPVWLQGICMS
jgi:hypothetical protein